MLFRDDEAAEKKLAALKVKEEVPKDTWEDEDDDDAPFSKPAPKGKFAFAMVLHYLYIYISNAKVLDG